MRSAASTIALALTLAGCGGGKSQDAAGRRRRRRARPAGAAAGYFTVPAAQLLAPAARRRSRRRPGRPCCTRPARSTGTTTTPPRRSPRSAARSRRLLVDTGAHVKQGDPLLYVSSPDISNAISAYRKARNRLDLAQHNLDRNKDLLEHKAISQRDFESAQADYNDAATDVETALEALRIFGVTAAGHHRGRAAERRHPPRAGDARRRSPAPSSRSWCCPGSSSRPARPRRS